MESERDHLEIITSGVTKSVDIQAIERELKQLWKTAAEVLNGEERHPVTRACLLNLLVYVVGDEEGERVSRVIAEITGRHPCRAIVIISYPHAPIPSIDAWISAHCHLPNPGEKQVCCEQISISVKGEAHSQLLGTVLPLLVPDLPVFLWWPGEPPFSSDIFHQMTEISDHLILDSMGFHNPGDSLSRSASLIRAEKPRDILLGDLNWLRLNPWRELTAQFFDPPNLRPLLDRLDRVTINYESKKHNASQALLLGGWLATRLKWDYVSSSHADGGERHFFRSEKIKSMVEVDILGRENGITSSGGVNFLELSTEDEPFARFSISRDADHDTVTLTSEIEGEGSLLRTVLMEVLSEGQLLCGELEVLGGDSIYEEALGMVGNLIS